MYITKRVIQGRARFLIHAKALRASRGLGGSQACMLLYKRRKPEGHLRGIGRVSAWTWVGGLTLPESSKPCLEAAPWTHSSRRT